MFDLERALEERAWRIASAAGAALAGMAAIALVEYGWRRLRGADPPKDAMADDVEWKEALAWTLASGLVIGASRLAVRRGLALVRRRLAEGAKP